MGAEPKILLRRPGFQGKVLSVASWASLVGHPKSLVSFENLSKSTNTDS